MSMIKFLKLILFLLLITVFGDSLSDGTAARSVEEKALVYQEAATSGREVQVAFVASSGSYVPASRLPYLSDAEIENPGGTILLLTFPRGQRSYITEFLLSLKDVLVRMARRDDALSSQRSKLFDGSAVCRCRPACEYYVFALRRIII